MKILGLDVSSLSTGFALMKDGYLDVNSIGTIQPNPKYLVGQKLVFFEKELKKLIKKYSPDEIVVENIFKGPNVNTLKLLSMWRGIVFKVSWEKLKKDPISIMPTEARKLVGVPGSSKEEAFAFVVKKYNFTNFVFKNDNDRTDAIILALSYFFPHSIKIKKTKRKKKQ